MNVRWMVEVQEGQRTLIGPFRSEREAFTWGDKNVVRDGERVAFTVRPMVNDVKGRLLEEIDYAWAEVTL